MRKRFVGLMIVILAICLTISIASAVDITADLVGHWPLDGDATDATGNNDGEVVGDPTWEEGRKDQAIDLDGVDDYVTIPDFRLKTNTVTFACWINGWRTNAWTGILCTRPDGFGLCEGIRFGGNDAIQYEWGGQWGWDQGPIMPQDEWALVAGVIEPEQSALYCYTDANGLESAERVFNHPECDMGATNTLRIGFDGQGGISDRIFRGLIDDARIYNRALTEAEIQALVDYDATKAVEPAGKLTTTWAKIKL